LCQGRRKGGGGARRGERKPERRTRGWRKVESRKKWKQIKKEAMKPEGLVTVELAVLRRERQLGVLESDTRGLGF
jgi:hypothetical protein